MSLLLTQGDAIRIPLADESVHCVVTSPPYWGLRDYGLDERGLGLEPTPEQYVANMVAVFREVRRVLRADGTVWLNLGDSYAGSGRGGNPEDSPWSGFVGNKQRENQAIEPTKPYIGNGLKPKDLCGIPWRVAFALQANGWWLRSDIIWSKKNPMPESVTDRPTKSHEYLFLLTKSARYYYDADAVREDATGTAWRPSFRGGAYINNATFDNEQGGISTDVGNVTADRTGRNRRTVWHIATAPYSGAHFATYPPALVEPCIKAGCPEGGLVLDPFCGSGTTLQVARQLGRNAIGLDLSLEYLHLARQRLSLDALDKWTKGVGKNGDEPDLSHKNKQVPGRQTHSFHDARQEKELKDLPLFNEMGR